MRLKGLDLNLLMILDTLLTERSVSMAATSLRLGQPAVSSALARLREHFSDELLMSMNRQMVPTTLALELQGPVRELLQGIDSIVHAMPEFDPRHTRREFVVLCSDYIADTFVPGVIQRLANDAPEATLAIRPLHAASGAATDIEDIARRGAHFLISPADYCARYEPSVLLFRERYCCAVWSGNPLVGDKLTPELLQTLPHIAMQFSNLQPDALDAQQLTLSRLRRNARITVDQFMLALQLTVGTRYLTLVPERLARKWAASLQLRVLEMPSDAINVEFDAALQWREGQMEDPALRWFRDITLEVARAH